MALMYLSICLQLYVCTCPWVHLSMKMYRLKSPVMPRSYDMICAMLGSRSRNMICPLFYCN